jgi:hypothetical protein
MIVTNTMNFRLSLRLSYFSTGGTMLQYLCGLIDWEYPPAHKEQNGRNRGTHKEYRLPPNSICYYWA